MQSLLHRVGHIPRFFLLSVVYSPLAAYAGGGTTNPSTRPTIAAPQFLDATMYQEENGEMLQLSLVEIDVPNHKPLDAHEFQAAMNFIKSHPGYKYPRWDSFDNPYGSHVFCAVVHSPSDLMKVAHGQVIAIAYGIGAEPILPPARWSGAIAWERTREYAYMALIRSQSLMAVVSIYRLNVDRTVCEYPPDLHAELWPAVTSPLSEVKFRVPVDNDIKNVKMMVDPRRVLLRIDAESRIPTHPSAYLSFDLMKRAWSNVELTESAPTTRP